MRVFIDYFTNRHKPVAANCANSSQYLRAMPGHELISSEPRTKLIKKTKRLMSVTDDVWNEHYLYAIEHFAELVQLFPASEIHHHSNVGGLLDHTLEVLHTGTKIAQGFVLPPNKQPEEISSNSDRWRFGAFIAILSHDIGKIVTDIEVVYREEGGEFKTWLPWFGGLPVGCEYVFRYRPRSDKPSVAKSLHEKAAISLMPKLLTRQAANWIFEDSELVSQLINTVSHTSFGGSALSEIVKRADSSSVGKNLGADTGVATQHSSSTPLHEKFMIALRRLIHDGQLKKNKPGAPIWVTEEETWVVSKTTVEAVRSELVIEGHRGIPQNPVRLFEVLHDHGLIIPNDHYKDGVDSTDKNSIWYGEVNFNPTDWRQKLTFLKFPNNLIWPNSKPETFDGTIIVVDKKGNAIQQDAPKENIVVGEGDPNIQMPTKANEEKYESVPIENNQKPTKRCQNANETQQASSKNISTKQKQEKTVIDKVVSEKTKTSSTTKARRPGARMGKEQVLLNNEFLKWLIHGIQNKQIRVNEPKAPVHILDNYIALVSPAIFINFFNKNPLKKRLYESKAKDGKAFTLLQRELEALDIHYKSTHGENICKLTVEGERKRAELRAYLLHRSCFPSLNNFTPNQAITPIL